jgi:PIN domain nuclease of toxin-antitoxin system
MRTSELPIESSDAILAGRLPWEHKDPFDRVIVAQALRRNLTVATRDAQIIDAALTPTLKI